MPSSATPNAPPMSRNVTQVISHSPSHSSVGRLSSDRLAVQRDRGLRQAAPVLRVDGLADGEHAVDRRLERTGKFGRHHFGAVPVVPEHRQGEPCSCSRRTTSPSSTTPRCAGQRIGRNGRGQQALVAASVRSSAADADRDRLRAPAAMRIADTRAAEQLQRVVDIALLDTIVLDLVLFDRDAQRGLCRPKSRRHRR